MDECSLDDDGGSVIIAVEADDNPSGHRQALWIRVGVVYDGDEIRDEAGVWIEYQQNYMSSGLEGPVLLTPDIWGKIVSAVGERLADFNPEDFREDK